LEGPPLVLASIVRAAQLRVTSTPAVVIGI
jgi:hypothetical protein